MTFGTKVPTIVLNRRGIRWITTISPAPRRGKSNRSVSLLGTKGKVEEDSKDRIHLLLGTGVPAMDEVDARMEAHGIPRPLVATGVDGDLPPNPTTPVQAGVPPHPTTPVQAGVPPHQAIRVQAGVHPHRAIRVQAGAHPHQAIQVEDGVPLRQEVAGVNPK
jgi:hypothetical protein